jgi:hypothetical protein
MHRSNNRWKSLRRLDAARKPTTANFEIIFVYGDHSSRAYSMIYNARLRTFATSVELTGLA